MSVLAVSPFSQCDKLPHKPEGVFYDKRDEDLLYIYIFKEHVE